jgi:hypothetical protein
LAKASFILTGKNRSLQTWGRDETIQCIWNLDFKCEIETQEKYLSGDVIVLKLKKGLYGSSPIICFLDISSFNLIKE